MRLNAANRSFYALVATAIVPYGLLALFGCGLLSAALYRLAADGPAGLHRNGQDLRPAAVFFAVVLTGTVVAIRSVHRQLRATRRLADEVTARRVPVPPVAAEAAGRAGVGRRVDVVADDAPYSFAYGLRRPRIVVSLGLVQITAPGELVAVLQHERYHLRNADTLKAVVARAAPSAFFFLPALGHLRDRYLAGRELAADRAVLRSSGKRELASVLLKVLDGPTWGELHTAAALGGGVLEQRVAQLEDGRQPGPAPIPWSARWLTTLGLAGLVILFAVAVAAGGADMSMEDPMSGTPGSGALPGIGWLACSASAGALVLIGLRMRSRTGPH